MSLLTALKYDTTFGSEQTAMLAAQEAGMSNAGAAFSKMGPWMAIAGAVQSAIGSYYSAKSQQYQLESQASTLRFQKSMSELNARAAEMQAQTLMMAGQRQLGAYTMRAGQQRGATRAALAARGGALGEGSNLEAQASQELVKEIDTLTINANTVRAAEAARMQQVNLQNQALLQGTSAANVQAAASTINPFASAFTSLLGSATNVGGQWLRDRELMRLLASR